MIEIKVFLFVCGLVFIGVLLCIIILNREKEEKPKKKKEIPDKCDIFGKLLYSIQFWTMMILMGILLFFLGLELSSFSTLEFFIGDLSKLEISTIETYFSSFITILSGYVGIVAIVLSILYGAYMNTSTSEREHIKLPEQIRIWLIFSVYFVIVMFFLFIHPLMERLSS